MVMLLRDQKGSKFFLETSQSGESGHVRHVASVIQVSTVPGKANILAGFGALMVTGLGRCRVGVPAQSGSEARMRRGTAGRRN
eukprot:1357186-Amorphochlora_amoeboformis.AAC.2